MSSTRNMRVDIARGIAIIAVILGHFSIINIRNVVFTFHLPIFFLITGYFTREGEKTGELIKKGLEP